MFRDGPGLIPVEKTVENYTPDGSVWLRTRVVFDADAVGVPTRWRSVVEDVFNGETQTSARSYHLLPQPGVTLDVKWFGDPTGRWPQVADE